MVPPLKYQGNLFKPGLNYGMDFDPKKKALMYNIVVEYTKTMEVKYTSTDGGFSEMRRMIQ